VFRTFQYNFNFVLFEEKKRDGLPDILAKFPAKVLGGVFMSPPVVKQREVDLQAFLLALLPHTSCSRLGASGSGGDTAAGAAAASTSAAEHASQLRRRVTRLLMSFLEVEGNEWDSVVAGNINMMGMDTAAATASTGGGAGTERRWKAATEPTAK
jgi:hypothetical protein